MSKIDLKFIAPYLPYKVNVSDGRTPFELTEHNFTNVYRYITKIHLRPMSELDSYFKILWDKKDEEVRKFMDLDFLERFNELDIDHIQYSQVDYLPVGLYNLLLKHHFDIFDLFEKGLGEEIIVMDFIKCDKCDSEKGEIFICERCSENYCEDCSATFDQFTQIDYNCCSSCSNKNFSDDSDF